ncbi:acyl carrier protein [Planomonospora venezuelensis]|uniref:Acyl carrier protein n=1 Tax=Planomonospora venezuelensis TaxID=1999 RepID=A0A841D271_PLAVE|nr:acyl carrier protein [Planomonospora venezuelensis]MBB5962427.1 acyl carrier protein [Planomonospora venezuelensis]GIN00809.1 hypothetical protein Pve01_24670 [Planomonospora venezuelensis]
MAFTDNDMRELLKAVGLEAKAGVEGYSRSFEELDLDSLARVEIATRIQDRFGVDVEEQVTAEETPEGLRRLVNERLTAAAK